MSKAYEIAKRCLRNCYRNEGILAGTTHFSDFWARDGLFATFGACEIEDFFIVKKEFELLLEYQKQDGQIPLRIGQKNMILNFLRIKSKRIRARYTEDKKNNVPKDQNSLFIIALWNYLQKTNDIEFAKQNYEKIKKTIDWYNTDELIEEEWYCSWDDNIRRKGKVIYTNALYFKALHDMHKISKLIKEDKNYLEKANKIKEKINQELWNGHYYVDWKDNEKHDYFTACGNLMTIIFGIADKEKAFKIIYFIEKEKLDEGFTIMNTNKKYKKSEKSMILRIFGMDDYQDGMYWIWPGCLDIMARQKAGFKYRHLMEKMEQKIIEYDNVYEVYELNGKPVNRLFYKSEQNFAWSSSFFIWAASECGEEKK
jgi:glycogen debranching enzyme